MPVNDNVTGSGMPFKNALPRCQEAYGVSVMVAQSVRTTERGTINTVLYPYIFKRLPWGVIVWCVNCRSVVVSESIAIL